MYKTHVHPFPHIHFLFNWSVGFPRSWVYAILIVRCFPATLKVDSASSISIHGIAPTEVQWTHTIINKFNSKQLGIWDYFLFFGRYIYLLRTWAMRIFNCMRVSVGLTNIRIKWNISVTSARIIDQLKKLIASRYQRLFPPSLSPL